MTMTEKQWRRVEMAHKQLGFAENNMCELHAAAISQGSDDRYMIKEIANQINNVRRLLFASLMLEKKKL